MYVCKCDYEWIDRTADTVSAQNKQSQGFPAAQLSSEIPPRGMSKMERLQPTAAVAVAVAGVVFIGLWWWGSRCKRNIVVVWYCTWPFVSLFRGPAADYNA